MKRFVIVFALLLIWTLPAVPASAGQEATAQVAQPAPGAPGAAEQAGKRLEQIKTRLALTPEQVEEVRPILQDEVKKLKALRETHSGGGRRDRRKLGRELKGIQGETDDQLKKVLSKEQMKELKKLRDEWRQQLRERAAQSRL
jgi:hypothetical protein